MTIAAALPVEDQPTAGGATSSAGVRLTGQSKLAVVLVISGTLSVAGTSSGADRLWEDYVCSVDATEGSVTISKEGVRVAFSEAESARAAISELRRRSGLTWEQLARLFGVSRRSVHFWASGKPLNAENEQRLFRVLDVVREADRGSARATRLALVATEAGSSPFDLLTEERFEEAREILGKGVDFSGRHLTPLSPEAAQDRAPLPPGELVEALQDPVHRDPGGSRAAKTSRTRRRGRS